MKMMNTQTKTNWIKNILITIVILLLLMVGAYFLIAYHFQNSKVFGPGTKIGSLYVTGMTVEEVNAKLLEDNEEKAILVKVWDKPRDKKMLTQKLTLPENVFQKNYLHALEELLNKQDAFAWYEPLLSSANPYAIELQDLKPDVFVDEELIRKTYDNWNYVHEQRKLNPSLTLSFTPENGYQITDTKGRVFDEEKGYILLSNALLEGKTEVDLSDAYYAAEYTEDELSALSLYHDLDDFLNFSVSYCIGDEKFILDHHKLANLLVFDDDDPFKPARDDETRAFRFDEEKVKHFLLAFLDKYNTLHKERIFHSSSGRTITLPGGTYGNKINEKEEFAFFLNALQNRLTLEREPVYETKAYAQGEDDIGDTYIEVDMGEQKLYFYEDGNLSIESPIVTGNMMRGRGTPEGCYYVYAKQKNRILRGPGYASHVNYWMPVVRGIGIHDALWRNEFGGEIYKSGGSHGCINVPLETAQNLYDAVEIGMPVLLFYE